jgi:hypothetical protein
VDQSLCQTQEVRAELVQTTNLYLRVLLSASLAVSDNFGRSVLSSAAFEGDWSVTTGLRLVVKERTELGDFE